MYVGAEVVGPSGAEVEADSVGVAVSLVLSVGVDVSVSVCVGVLEGVEEAVALALEVLDGPPQPVTLGTASGPVVMATTSVPQFVACAR